MAKRERKPDTLKQKKTRHYVKIILGVYLMYTAYNIVNDMRAGIEADNPVLFYVTAAIFLAVGAVLTITSFRAAMKISAQELKAQEESGQEEMKEQEALCMKKDGQENLSGKKSAEDCNCEE